MTHTDLPYIVILDWDGTIAGKVDYQSQRHAMYEQFKRYGLKIKKDAKIPKAFLPTQHLIRPGFASFIHELTQYFHENVYFFVYTASEKNWAYKEIQWVEKAHGIKFQRPIFTRDECVTDVGGNHRKSIHHIFPRVIHSLESIQPIPKPKKKRF